MGLLHTLHSQQRCQAPTRGFHDFSCCCGQQELQRAGRELERAFRIPHMSEGHGAAEPRKGRNRMQQKPSREGKSSQLQPGVVTEARSPEVRTLNHLKPEPRKAGFALRGSASRGPVFVTFPGCLHVQSQGQLASKGCVCKWTTSFLMGWPMKGPWQELQTYCLWQYLLGAMLGVWLRSPTTEPLTVDR